MPFGMVKLSPDNQSNVWNGGYEYTIGSISGFSHLHAMGLNGLSIMPTTGSLYANEGWMIAAIMLSLFRVIIGY